MKCEDLKKLTEDNLSISEFKAHIILGDILNGLRRNAIKGISSYEHTFYWNHSMSQDDRKGVVTFLDRELRGLGYTFNWNFKKGIYGRLIIDWENSTQPEFNIEGEVGIEN